jgi:hypothetical protein
MFSRAVSALYTADTGDASGLFTLVSRVNFVGAMRNEFSQSGGGIFAVDRSEMNHSRKRDWGFGDTASIFRPDRAVSELGLGCT